MSGNDAAGRVGEESAAGRVGEESAAERVGEESAAPPPQPRRSGKLLRRSNSDRLRMHAPSSIQVAAPSSAPGEWKLAIPLLSPLDLELSPWQPPPEPARTEATATEPPLAPPPAKWEHPAAPFYYEPVPSNAAPFVRSHCAS